MEQGLGAQATFCAIQHRLRAMVGMHSPEDMYANVPSGCGHNRKEVETFQIHISLRTDNHVVMFPCNAKQRVQNTATQDTWLKAH